jgi:3-hydroxyisobutyrate dehydrogenase-like beta-hydroxyacid dehydrogenase
MMTIAILGPGDLGTRLAALLAGAGHRTIATLEGRSDRSAALWNDAGLETAPTLAAALGEADIVISTVPPDAALAAAQAFVAAAPGARWPVYADANSISPGLARAIAALVEGRGGRVAGATLHGNPLAVAGQIFLSGSGAGPVAAAVDGVLRVVHLGDDPGRAKELKLLVAAMSKGLCALYLETAQAAARAGLLDDVDAALRHAYPAMMDDLDRMVPTYARHSGRRIDELTALAELESSLGVEPDMARAVVRTVSRAAQTPSDQHLTGGAEGWTARAFIERLVADESTPPLG